MGTRRVILTVSINTVKSLAKSEAGDDVSRRRLLLTTLYGIWALICTALGTPALIYLFLPTKMRREADWVEVGDIAKLEPRVPAEMVFHKTRIDGWKVTSEKQIAWVVKFSDQNIAAFGPQCTHLGCAYHWEESTSEFLCPCHSSVFSIDGQVISGPALSPLNRYETRIDNGKLLLGALREARGPNT